MDDGKHAGCAGLETATQEAVRDCLARMLLPGALEGLRGDPAKTMAVNHLAEHLLAGAFRGVVEAFRAELDATAEDMEDAVVNAASTVIDEVRPDGRSRQDAVISSLHEGISDGRHEYEERLQASFDSGDERNEVLGSAALMANQAAERLTEELGALWVRDSALTVGQGIHVAVLALMEKLESLGPAGQMIATNTMGTCLARILSREREHLKNAETVRASILDRLMGHGPTVG